MLQHSYDELLEVIKVLNERVWEGRLTGPKIEAWLGNFRRADERDALLALHLLAHFMFFGNREIRVLLQALYRDLYRSPLLEQLIANEALARDAKSLSRALDEKLAKTRFLGVGNPSESGTHYLYYFRQENGLSKELFINSHQVFRRDPDGDGRLIRDPTIEHYVFIDDLCGSGSQAQEYSTDIVEELKRRNPNASVDYYALFGFESGLDIVRKGTRFDRVAAVCVLDETFKCFGDASRYYLADEQSARHESRAVMEAHGKRLYPSDPLGFKDGQLLLGFFHNVPDNTLPVIWSTDAPWVPIFARYPKKY